MSQAGIIPARNTATSVAHNGSGWRLFPSRGGCDDQHIQRIIRASLDSSTRCGPGQSALRKVLAAILIIAGSCALAYQGRAAAAQDLKTFNASESYLADGQTLTLTQTLGQV